MNNCSLSKTVGTRFWVLQIERLFPALSAYCRMTSIIVCLWKKSCLTFNILRKKRKKRKNRKHIPQIVRSQFRWSVVEILRMKHLQWFSWLLKFVLSVLRNDFWKVDTKWSRLANDNPHRWAHSGFRWQHPFVLQLNAYHLQKNHHIPTFQAVPVSILLLFHEIRSLEAKKERRLPKKKWVCHRFNEKKINQASKRKKRLNKPMTRLNSYWTVADNLKHNDTNTMYVWRSTAWAQCIRVGQQ